MAGLVKGATIVAEALLDAGASIDAPIAGNKTALMAAAGAGDVDVLTMLIARGADPCATDDDGQQALDYAQSGLGGTASEVLELLPPCD